MPSAASLQLPAWTLRRLRELFDRLPPRPRLSQPLPPRRLRARAGAPGDREFIEGGRLAAAALAAPLGESVYQLESILDFGCGSGRVLPHVSALAPKARCSGCDIDPAAIAWAERYLPGYRWRTCGFEPPLPFDSGSFALVYSISVFSHLGEPLQDRWVVELHRVLAPGGLALLSVHGAHAFEQFRTGAVRTSWCRRGAFAREPLKRDEFVFEPYVRSVWNRGELPGVTGAYGLTFHGADYVRTRWDRHFEVLDIRERALSDWQDLVVCRARIG
jgi:SAM-dependent methyltransferase